MNYAKLTINKVMKLAKKVADAVNEIYPGAVVKAYAIPRGGIPAAFAVLKFTGDKMVLVDDPEDAHVFIDDIIDSGATMERYCDQYPGRPFFALIDKTEPGKFYNQWVVFPWESTAESSIEDNIVRLLQFVGEDTTRGGLAETPNRVAKAWQFWCSGYAVENPADLLKVFEDGAEHYDEMVIVKDIPFYSQCEHHLAPFFGTATIAYVPSGKIVGLSKLSRLIDVFARRLQVQERMTNQIADALQEALQPVGIGVIIKARHLCMESRGICKQGHYTVTSALRGVIKDLPEARAEFMELSKWSCI